VPQAVICFLDSDSYEDAVRNAVSLGGDSDTLACIAGGIAEAFYGGVPAHVALKVQELLPSDLLAITSDFRSRFAKVP
jgi:ADP-ribosylglycohydrolase